MAVPVDGHLSLLAVCIVSFFFIFFLSGHARNFRRLAIIFLICLLFSDNSFCLLCFTVSLLLYLFFFFGIIQLNNCVTMMLPIRFTLLMYLYFTVNIIFICLYLLLIYIFVCLVLQIYNIFRTYVYC